MVKNFKRVLFALLIFSITLSITACTAKTDSVNTTAKDLTNTKTTARTEIWKAINTGATGSASVAITDNGKLVYSEGFGMADREKDIPVSNETVFDIGSVSKVFTATCIMLLVDEGRVELDKPVTAYLPDFKMADERYKDITVRMLLNHTSGLPGTTSWNNMSFEYNQNIYTDLLTALSKSTLKHKPGEFAAYCNDGFTLAEMIVAKISGKSFGDFLKERIFKPLGMSHSALGVGRIPEGMVPAEYYRPDGKSEPLEIMSVLGAGGISSTPEDLCKFADSFNNGKKILSADSLAEMLKKQPCEFESKLKSGALTYGLGWDYTELAAYPEKDLTLTGKGGNTPQYSSFILSVPSKRISVSVIGTGSSFGAGTIAQDVLTAYLAEKGLTAKNDAAVTAPKKAQSIPSELMTYEGYYGNESNTLHISMDSKNGSLSVYGVNGKDEVPMLSAVYNDGYFYNGNHEYYFATLDGTPYFLMYFPNVNLDYIYAEKLQAVDKPIDMSIPMDGKQWLRRNVTTDEVSIVLSSYIMTSSKIAGLPGYVDFFGIKIIKSAKFATMPVKSQRELSELRLYNKGGATWAWLSGADYMPAELAVPLKDGANTANIGKDGYNEWFKSDFDTILKFKKPDKGRVIVFGPDNTVLYDSLVDSSDIFAPAGSFIEVNGEPRDTFKVTATAEK